MRVKTNMGTFIRGWHGQAELVRVATVSGRLSMWESFRSDLSFAITHDGESFGVAQDPEVIEWPVEPPAAMLRPGSNQMLWRELNLARFQYRYEEHAEESFRMKGGNHVSSSFF